MFRRKKGRTEVTIETREVTTIRIRNGWPGLRYCPMCRQGVCGLSRAQAAVIFEVEDRLLGELLVADQIHWMAEAAICGNSLVKYFR